MALICHCHGVRSQSIYAAALAASGDVEGVQEACLAGTSCGGCLAEVESICGSARAGAGQGSAAA